jgi:hypothetical protein
VWSSSAPGVATVDQEGWVSHVADGVATITYAVGGDLSRSITLPFSTTVPAQVDTFHGYVSGSLSAHLSAAVDARLAGKSAAQALRIYTIQDHATGMYTRNPSVWCADWDLSPISPWNGTGGGRMAGTLISPRHILFAAHYQPAVGTTLRFVTMAGAVVVRTLSAKRTHPAYTPYYPDLTVGLLDADVPEGISFCRILSEGWEDYLPALSYLRPIPALTLDQEEKALVTDWSVEGFSTRFSVPTSAQRLAFYEAKIGGDSGNPALLWVGGYLVLLTLWTRGGAGSGTSVAYHRASINLMMSQLGGGYQLSSVDLSAFPSY